MSHPSAQLYECQVMHCRLKPKQRPFQYRVFMLSLDLDDLPKSPWFSYDSFNLFSLHQQDHVELGKEGIRENLLHWLREQRVQVPNEICVRLIAFPRVLGYAFKPVSFYYLTHADGTPFLSVAEVGNTFGEMKLYLVDGKKEKAWHRRTPKNFYVSPFSDPGDSFDFTLGHPLSELRVNIDDYRDDEKILLSTVRGKARPFTSSRLFWYGLKYPFLSLKVIALIHWHALLLWLRKVPYFKKTDRREAQLDVLKPHSSLTKDHSS